MELKTYKIVRKVDCIYTDTETLLIRAESEEKAREQALIANVEWVDCEPETQSEFAMYLADRDDLDKIPTVDIYSIEEQND